MLLRQLRSSLIAKATFLIGVLFVIAVVRVVFVIGMNWMAQHDDTAIEATSALRSHVYQMSLHMALQDGTLPSEDELRAIERHLDSPSMLRALQRPGRQDVLDAWLQVREEWRRDLRPALAHGDRDFFLHHAGPFVAGLDRVAVALQSEHMRLQILDQKQVIVTMLLVISVQLLVLYTLHCLVARPMRRLLAGIDHFRAGNLDVRVALRGDDEIGLLAGSFNTMADALARSHRELEGRVAQKVAQLAQANAILKLLFRSSHSLAHSTDRAADISMLLDRFQEHLPGLHLRLELEAGSGLALPRVCGGDATGVQVERHAVQNQGQAFGTLCACYEAPHAHDGWEGELVQALADLIGSALMLDRQRERDDQLLVFNERNTIARELHDSLAQSLSFMKLQISRLQALIQQGEDCHAVETVAEELRGGINEAYAQLRQLVTTFRLDLASGSLEEMLQVTVREFARRSNLAIHLQAMPLQLPLSAEEKAHMVQILREALTNCIRHAEALRVDVGLRQEGDAVELVVEDDGNGLPPAAPQQSHHGIAIMQERARSIGGALRIEARAPRGTRLSLRFRPQGSAPSPEGVPS